MDHLRAKPGQRRRDPGLEPVQNQFHLNLAVAVGDMGEQRPAASAATAGMFLLAALIVCIGLGLGEVRRWDVGRAWRGVEWDTAFPPDRMLPALEGKEKERPRTLFWRTARPGGPPYRAVRDGSWKYIDHGSDEQHLYDLASDVAEQKDLAAMSPDRCAELKGKIGRWEAELR